MQQPTLAPIPHDENLKHGSALCVFQAGEWVPWDGAVLDTYKASDIDIPNDTKYYGFLNSAGAWYILREISSTGSFRFTRGTADYDDAWTDRATHTYTYFDLIF